MNYSELVDSYIQRSGLSLAEITKRMAIKGVRIDRSYLSMLKNNKTKYSASEEINRALAEVTEGDPDKLILIGYLEKAPKAVKQILENTVNFSTFLKNDESYWKERASKSENELSRLKKQLINLTNTFHEEVKNDM